MLKLNILKNYYMISYKLKFSSWRKFNCHTHQSIKLKNLLSTENDEEIEF